MLKEYEKMKEDLIKFIEDFSLFIKQCCHIVWGVEKIHKVKIQMLQGQKMEEQCFYQNVQYVIIKGQNLSHSKKLVGY